MDIIIDASAIIAVIANEPARDGLIGATRDANLIAPASVHWEIGNAFSAMLKRRRISLEQALGAMAAYQAIEIDFVEVDLQASLRLAAEANIYAYDAYLIQAAVDCRCPLISLDRGLVERAKEVGISVVEVEP